MNLKIYTTLLTIILFPFYLSSQEDRLSSDIISPSPEAASLAKSLNYPMNNNTGVPNITIPLYEAHFGDITIPISVSYHAAGFKINEQSPVTGLGWSLSTDLQITREVRGRDDLSRDGYYFNTYCKVSNYTYTDLDKIGMNSNSIDTQPDKFYYKLLGKSGEFYFCKSPSGIQAIPFPYNGVKIDLLKKEEIVKAFQITDTDGTIYVFGGSENLTELNSPYGGGDALTYHSSYKCLEIIPANRSDTIHFSYKHLSDKISYTGTESIDLYEYDSKPIASGLTSRGIQFPSDIRKKLAVRDTTYKSLLENFDLVELSVPRCFYNVLGNSSKLSMIEYERDKGQWITSEYVAEFSAGDPKRRQTRLGLASIHSKYGTVSFSYHKKIHPSFGGCLNDQLDRIEIRNCLNQVIKNIRFCQSSKGEVEQFEIEYPYAPLRTSLTWYLDSLIIQGERTDTEPEIYMFNYCKRQAISNHDKGCNAWGGMNSSTCDRLRGYNDIRVPVTDVTTTYYRSRSQYDYDSNFRYSFGTDVEPEYHPMNAVEIGFQDIGILECIVYPTGGYSEFNFEMNRTIYPEDPYGYAAFVGGLRVQSINHYDEDGNFVSGKEYEYEESDVGLSLPAIANMGKQFVSTYGIPKKVMYIQPEDIPTNGMKRALYRPTEKKTTFLPNSVFDLIYSSGAPVFYKKITETQFGKDREPFGRIEYNYYNPNSFGYNITPRVFETSLKMPTESWRLGPLQKEIIYKYESGKYKPVNSKEYHYESSYTNHRVYYRFAYATWEIVVNNEVNDGLLGLIKPNDEDAVHDFGGALLTGNLLKRKCTEKQYIEGDTLISITNYDYDPYGQVVKAVTTYENGETITKENVFPTNFYGTDPVVTSMKNRNMLAVPIRQTEYWNKYIHFGQINIYSAQNPGLVECIYTTSNTSSQAEGQTRAVSIPTEYYQEEKYTYNYYNRVSGVTTYNKPSVVYIWGYKGCYPIAEIVNATEEEVRNAIGHDITKPLNPYTENLILTSDYLRKYLPNSQVTTYTYLPLVGIKTKTDPRGVTTYYEYDKAGRLRTIKDANGHIIESYEYHYLTNKVQP